VDGKEYNTDQLEQIAADNKNKQKEGRSQKSQK
jgi:hypothetical protein